MNYIHVYFSQLFKDSGSMQVAQALLLLCSIKYSGRLLCYERRSKSSKIIIIPLVCGENRCVVEHRCVICKPL